MKQYADGVVVDDKRGNSLQKSNPKFATITQDQLDSLMIASNINNEAENFETKISGRFVMKEANCAGFNFISPTLVTWTNEIDCEHPDTLKIRWLDNATFYTQDIVRLNENCPPRIWIHQVVSFDGLHLTLKDVWTGWNDNTDERTEFIKREAED
ncbi:MAG: hypothetical protein H6607_10880 [Flavobacteriales bacterium]|nr:hypothetical protein [Flavobacteriales bacterium]